MQAVASGASRGMPILRKKSGGEIVRDSIALAKKVEAVVAQPSGAARARADAAAPSSSSVAAETTTTPSRVALAEIQRTAGVTQRAPDRWLSPPDGIPGGGQAQLEEEEEELTRSSPRPSPKAASGSSRRRKPASITSPQRLSTPSAKGDASVRLTLTPSVPDDVATLRSSPAVAAPAQVNCSAPPGVLKSAPTTRAAVRSAPPQASGRLRSSPPSRKALKSSPTPSGGTPAVALWLAALREDRAPLSGVWLVSGRTERRFFGILEQPDLPDEYLVLAHDDSTGTLTGLCVESHGDVTAIDAEPTAASAAEDSIRFVQWFDDPDSAPVAWSASLRDGQLVGSWSGGVAGTFTAVRQDPANVTDVLSKVAAKGVGLPALSVTAQAASGDGAAPARRARIKPQRTTAKSPPGSRPRSRGRASRGRSSQEDSSVAVLCGNTVTAAAAPETSLLAAATADDVLRVAKERLAAQLAAEQKTVEASRALAESMNQHLSLDQLESAVAAAEQAGLDSQRDQALVAAKRRLAVEAQRQAEAAARLAEAMSRSQTAEEMKLAIMQAEQAGLVSGSEPADDVDLAERVRITRAHSVSEREDDLSRTAVSWTIWPTNRSLARDDGTVVKLAGTFPCVVAQAEEHRMRAFTKNTWSDSWEYGQRASRDLAGEAIVLHLSSMLRSGGLFTDEHFPPDDTSLFAAVKSGRGEISRADLMDQREFLSGVTDVTWRRAMDIGDLRRKPVVFSGAIDPDDTRQGKLGDSYLLTAIANCATPQHDNLISDLIVEDGGMHGLYGVKLFVNGIWTTIVVDDWFPCEWRDGMWLPVFASSAQHFDPESDEKELWAMLIEKAFAKLHGSYQAIAMGDVDDAQNYLTGGFVETTAVNSAQETHEWRAMLDLNVDDRSRPVFCTCSLREGVEEDAVEEVSGLLDAHSYSLLAVVESSQGHRLLKLRNRWSSGDWRGAFHNQDPIWTGRLMRDVGFEAVDDGACFSIVLCCFYIVLCYFCAKDDRFARDILDVMAGLPSVL